MNSDDIGQGRRKERRSRHPNNEDKRLLHIPPGTHEMVQLESHVALSISSFNSAAFPKVFIVLTFPPLLILIMIALSISKTLFIFKALYEHYLIN